jgi:hypothetical protein
MAKPIEQYIKETMGDLVLQVLKAQAERDAALEQVAELQKMLGLEKMPTPAANGSQR